MSDNLAAKFASIQKRKSAARQHESNAFAEPMFGMKNGARPNAQAPTTLNQMAGKAAGGSLNRLVKAPSYDPRNYSAPFMAYKTGLSGRKDQAYVHEGVYQGPNAERVPLSDPLSDPRALGYARAQAGMQSNGPSKARYELRPDGTRVVRN